MNRRKLLQNALCAPLAFSAAELGLTPTGKPASPSNGCGELEELSDLQQKCIERGIWNIGQPFPPDGWIILPYGP